MSEVPQPPLEKYGPGVKDLLIQGLKANRHEDAPQFLIDLSQFLQMPIESLQTSQNMLKVFVGEAVRRMDTDLYADLPVDEMKAKVEAFMTDLGNFLQLCTAGETIRENLRTGTHEDVKASVRRVLAKKPAAPTEAERSNFIERLLNCGYPSSGLEFHRIQKRLEERDAKANRSISSRISGWFRAEPPSTPQEPPKEIPPYRVLDELRNTLPVKKQSILTLKDIRQEANDKNIPWQNYDSAKPERSDIWLVLTADDVCLVVDSKKMSFEIDDTRPKA